LNKIDPDLPLERKKYIAQNSGAQYVLTSSDITTADLFGSAAIYLEDSSVQLDIACKGDEDIECMDPDGLAYLLYTSGEDSDLRPKKVELNHQQALLGTPRDAS
jgi:non-ribosomal peptide synthetase component F